MGAAFYTILPVKRALMLVFQDTIPNIHLTEDVVIILAMCIVTQVTPNARRHQHLQQCLQDSIRRHSFVCKVDGISFFVFTNV